MIATKIKLALLGGSLLAAFLAGAVTRDAFCDAAKARADLAAERLAHAATRDDLKAAQNTAAHTKNALDLLERNVKAREETIRERETEPADGAAHCRLDQRGADWLRRITPR